MNKTLIAVPCMDMMHTGFVRAFTSLAKPENAAVAFIPGTLIYEARNTIAQNAVREGFEQVLWLDSDMDIPPDTMVRLAADMDTGKDFVTAMYYRRKPPTNPVVFDKVEWKVHDSGVVETGATSYLHYPPGQVFEIAGAGFGCCMTSGNLLKATVERYGSPFTPLMGMGEDLAFCWRAGQMGFKMYCDSRIICGHIGQYTYSEKDYLMGVQAHE